jgi:hypothetical protein
MENKDLYPLAYKNYINSKQELKQEIKQVKPKVKERYWSWFNF